MAEPVRAEELALDAHLRGLEAGRLEQEFITPAAVARAVRGWHGAPLAQPLLLGLPLVVVPVLQLVFALQQILEPAIGAAVVEEIGHAARIVRRQLFVGEVHGQPGAQVQRVAVGQLQIEAAVQVFGQVVLQIQASDTQYAVPSAR